METRVWYLNNLNDLNGELVKEFIFNIMMQVKSGFLDDKSLLIQAIEVVLTTILRSTEKLNEDKTCFHLLTVPSVSVSNYLHSTYKFI